MRMRGLRTLTTILLVAGCGTQATHDGGDEEIEDLSGNAQIQATHSNKCAEVAGGSTTRGAAVQQQNCTSNSDEKWTIKTVGTNTFTLVNVKSGLCMDVSGASTADGAPIIQWTCSGADNQKWKITKQGTGFKIQSVHSGKCLDVTGASTANGVAFEQWSCHNSGNQTFKLNGASGSTPPPSSGPGLGDTSRCNAAGLVFKSANKTNFTSYPAPGSEECIKFSGCEFEGQFAACSGVKSKAWVQAHNIVAVFPDRSKLNLHDLCLKSGSKEIIVTVIDECGDQDCSGCCTENKGSADELIDIESFTNARWGVEDGRIQWADLGPTKGDGCSGN
jgi:hypothetical protein